VGERDGAQVKQRTLLNLGKHFNLPKEQWGRLCARIEELLTGRQRLPGLDEMRLLPDVERYAQQFAASIAAKRAGKEEGDREKKQQTQYVNIDVNSFEMLHNRQVGVEHTALWAMEQLNFKEILAGLDYTKTETNRAIAAITGRMAKPGSEESTWKYLTETSALGELLDTDFSSSSVMSLHRISDKLIIDHAKIEEALYSRLVSLFNIQQTVTLYDLTNTFFEGSVPGNKKAARGFSKEKRSDCPLVTLGLMLDSLGFVKRSEVFPGNAAEGGTLQAMLDKLGANRQALVVMDRGIATKKNIDWLIENNYKYLVVSRERSRTFDFSKSEIITTAKNQEISVYKEINAENTEAKLYCHSPKRMEKENGISKRFMNRYVKGLEDISKSLTKPRTKKDRDTIMRKIGRLQEKCRGASQHYEVIVTDNGANKEVGEPLLATSITWEEKAVEGSIVTHPGVYIIRTNDLSLSEHDLWKTYIMLTDLEAVFRSLKSELGLRPIYHRKSERTDGHLFISVLAYQCVQTIRGRLRSEGIKSSWVTLRDSLSNHSRTTGSFRQSDGSTLHIRKAQVPSAEVLSVYRALGISASPGGTKKTVYSGN
jgi:hypothetical protein